MSSAILSLSVRNSLLKTMADLVDSRKGEILLANKEDIGVYKGGDLAMLDRLKLDEGKIKGMVSALKHLVQQQDPLGIERYRYTHPNGMVVKNLTAPFGTVLIIYESRPDVTIEAAAIAFKSGNRILLKGGKEAIRSNRALALLWQEALRAHGLAEDWVAYLDYNRDQTRAYLQKPTQKVDLIVPRGGEKLIAFVKANASCPVIVSGRGNNFLFVDREADTAMALAIIINAKTTKISACNALDKVLIDRELPGKEQFLHSLVELLREQQVTILAEQEIAQKWDCIEIKEDSTWFEEYLDYKIALGEVSGLEEAIDRINLFSGGHSATVVSANAQTAIKFMEGVDAAAVYHNASTRFTDGGQFGLGGELAISTDKLHQRGPLGMQHLTTNKWYIMGSGQIRE